MYMYTRPTEIVIVTVKSVWPNFIDKPNYVNTQMSSKKELT